MQCKVLLVLHSLTHPRTHTRGIHEKERLGCQAENSACGRIARRPACQQPAVVQRKLLREIRSPTDRSSVCV